MRIASFCLAGVFQTLAAWAILDPGSCPDYRARLSIIIIAALVSLILTIISFSFIKDMIREYWEQKAALQARNCVFDNFETYVERGFCENSRSCLHHWRCSHLMREARKKKEE